MNSPPSAMQVRRKRPGVAIALPLSPCGPLILHAQAPQNALSHGRDPLTGTSPESGTAAAAVAGFRVAESAWWGRQGGERLELRDIRVLTLRNAHAVTKAMLSVVGAMWSAVRGSKGMQYADARQPNMTICAHRAYCMGVPRLKTLFDSTAPQTTILQPHSH